MFMRPPTYCRPAAYERLAAQLPVLESPEALVAGAVAIAAHELDDADERAVDEHLQGWADTIAARLRSRALEPVLAHTHDLLFDELGFTGNREDYGHPDNALLPRVLATRRGLPITLCLVYRDVLRRLGVRVHGLNLPGHFLAGVESPGGVGVAVIDCFDGGRLLTATQAIERVHRATGTTPPTEQPRDEHGEPPPVTTSAADFPRATNRQWLARIAANLLHVYLAQDRPDDAAAMREMIGLINLGG